MNDSKYVEIKDEGFGPKDVQFNKAMIDLQSDWPGMAEAYEKKFNRPWTNWEFREHARTWAEAWKSAGSNKLVYELCDTSSDEMYYSLGMFKSIDDIKSEIEKHDASGDSVSDYAEDREELTVVEHKFGFSSNRKEVIKFIREKCNDCQWRTSL